MFIFSFRNDNLGAHFLIFDGRHSQFTKYKFFLWASWFLAKTLSNFVCPLWKLDNTYYHRTWPKYLITAFCMGTHLLIWIFNLFSISSVRNLPNWSWSQPCATPWPVFWVSIMKIHCRSILWLKVKFFLTFFTCIISFTYLIRPNQLPIPKKNPNFHFLMK